MITFRFFLLAAACVASLSMPAAAQDTLRFGSIFPDGSVYNKAFRWWIEQVEAEADGALDIEIFTGGSLGRDPRQQVELLHAGVIDIVFLPLLYEPGAFPDNEIIELPLLIGDQETASKAFWTLYSQGQLRGYEELKPISLFTTPVFNMHVNGALGGPETLKGLRIRAGSSIQPKIIEALGGVPVANVAITEAAQAMNRKVVDATFASWDAVFLFKLRQVSQSHINVPLGFSTMMVSMSKDRFDRLSPESQAAIEAWSGYPIIDNLTGMAQSVANAEIAKADEDGALVALTAELAAEYDAQIVPVVQAWANEHPRGAELINALHEVLQGMDRDFASETARALVTGN